MAIVYTHNFYTFNTNTEDKPKYFESYEEIEFDGWGLVNSGTKHAGIINAYSLKIFDYFLFFYFEDYTQYVPLEDQQIIYETVLSNPEDLEPSKLLAFIEYLEAFLAIRFPVDEFYYDIEVLGNPILNGSPIHTQIEGKRVIISTSHTTFTDLSKSNGDREKYLTAHKHQARASYYNTSSSKWEDDWIDIEDGKQLKTNNNTLVVKKIYLGTRLEYTLGHLKKMCQLAIHLGLKVKRNTDWV